MRASKIATTTQRGQCLKNQPQPVTVDHIPKPPPCRKIGLDGNPANDPFSRGARGGSPPTHLPHPKGENYAFVLLIGASSLTMCNCCDCFACLLIGAFSPYMRFFYLLVRLRTICACFVYWCVFAYYLWRVCAQYLRLLCLLVRVRLLSAVVLFFGRLRGLYCEP